MKVVVIDTKFTLQIKQAIQQISGFKYIIDSLNVLSSIGRKQLLSLPFLTDKNGIETALAETETACGIINAQKNEKPLSMLFTKLMQLRNISGTIQILSTKNVLNDIELFEIKYFALLAESIREYVTELKITFIDIPSLTTVIDTLDPEKKRIPHFYIYDQYSSVLASLRTQLNRMTANKSDEKDIEPVRFQAQRLEDEIRKNITYQLFPHAQTLSQALQEVAQLDIVLAKVTQIKELGLCKPIIGDNETSYKGLFHPEIKSLLRQQNKDFQPVDIAIPMQPTVITGANMAGKSVLLKSVALAQAMAQFGFYVAAQSATVVPVEQIVISAGDDEDELQGLSSFAAEMLRLNTTIENTHRGIRQLVLIDELARTTNPAEGKAIVCGMLDFLIQHNIQSLITTHYSIDISCRKLCVKGFTENRNNETITISNINSFIDYSLEENTEKEVPHEALKIAEIIRVDKDILERTKKYLIK